MLFPKLASYFDEVADKYGTWYQAQSPGAYALCVRQRRVLELLDQPGGKVLDVGCGPGVLAQELLDLGYEVWGVDISPGMIEQCHKELGETNRAHFAVGDATNLAFPDGFFDVVICTGVVDFIQSYESVISEMSRIVKKPGILLISFPNLLSPYTAWKKFIFYSTVALLRPIYYRLVGDSQPLSLPLYRNKLHTARTATKLMARHGVEVTNVVYFYFNVFLAPLDEFFPRWTLDMIKRLEYLRFGKLRWLGGGFILKAKKC